MRGLERGIVPLLLLLSLAMTPGCDSDQPLQDEERVVELNMRATGAVIDGYDTWDVFRDNDNDSLPDDVGGAATADVTLWCDNPRSGFQPSSIPWFFSAEISVTRAGESSRTVLTSPAATTIPIQGNNNEGNLTEYDTVVGANNQPAPPGLTSALLVPQLPGNPICPVGSTCVGCTPADSCRFRFGNPRALSTAHLDLILSDTNFLHDYDPGTYGGVCPGIYHGPARLDGQPLPYRLTIAKGDTVHVQIRRFEEVPQGMQISSFPDLSSTFLADGQFVPEGTQSAPDTDFESGFAFSYTAR
jgi:hypothetical protein